MIVKVTEENVIIVQCSVVNEGDFNVHYCTFELPESFVGLNVTAAFNNIPVPVTDNQCIIPCLAKGTVTLGVYAYKEESDVIELMYSPKPTAFCVEKGSYSTEIGNSEIIEISEIERYRREVMSYIDEKALEVRGVVAEISDLVGGAD